MCGILEIFPELGPNPWDLALDPQPQDPDFETCTKMLGGSWTAFPLGPTSWNLALTSKAGTHLRDLDIQTYTKMLCGI